jgi:hypothetical protein
MNEKTTRTANWELEHILENKMFGRFGTFFMIAAIAIAVPTKERHFKHHSTQADVRNEVPVSIAEEHRPDTQTLLGVGETLFNHLLLFLGFSLHH